MRCVLIAVSAVLLLTLIGCGSRRNEPSVAQPSALPDAANQAIFQDIRALGKAANPGGSAEALNALNDLLNAAESRPGDREGWKGTALIRARLPQIVERFLAEYPRTVGRLGQVRTQTRAGAAVRAWLLGSYHSQRRELSQLSADVASGTYAWGAVLGWRGKHDATIARSYERLQSILRRLPAAQQHAVDRALTQAFGR